MNMKTNQRLIALSLAFGLLGTTCAFAKPSQCFENGRLSHEQSTVTRPVPSAATSGMTGYMHAPAAHAVQDDWPSNMLLG
jgi:hypothetical protein